MTTFGGRTGCTTAGVMPAGAGEGVPAAGAIEPNRLTLTVGANEICGVTVTCGVIWGVTTTWGVICGVTVTCGVISGA